MNCGSCKSLRQFASLFVESEERSRREGDDANDKSLLLLPSSVLTTTRTHFVVVLCRHLQRALMYKFVATNMVHFKHVGFK